MSCDVVLHESLTARVPKYMRLYNSALLMSFFFVVRPKFTKTSGNTEAISGNAVRLFCRVSGFPRPTVVWKKNGRIMKASRRQKLLANGDLEIMPVVQGDNGYYTCEARNAIGSTFHTTRVVVKGTQSM